MEKGEFIKYLGAMRTVFDAVSAAASSLMEMNAMNVSPTEEESGRLQSAFEEISGHICRLRDDARKKVSEYRAKQEASAAASKKAMEEYTEMQKKLILLEKENGDAKVELAQKSAERETRERECKEAERRLAEVRRRKEEEVEKSRKKQNDLKNWFWVPGYGLYLAIDTLVNELNNEIGSLNARLERERRFMEELECQYKKIQREVEEREQEGKQIKEKMAAHIKQMECQNDLVHACKQQLLYWEDFYMQMSRLEEKLKSEAGSPDMLYELVSLMETFEDAAKEQAGA
ncbi:MAG TPA: hypothetical protein DCZ40_02515 [Lachnospiraceae bacterium]|nr:hypothetical protein [Lachnospiraceae bacterium]